MRRPLRGLPEMPGLPGLPGLPESLTVPVDQPVAPVGRGWAGRWVPRFYLGIAAALIPWTVWLGLTLPLHQAISHYRGVWVGFDIVLIVVLARIGWFAARRDPRVVLTAAAGATMLVADAWFDVMTAATAGGRTAALVDAAVLELPGALLCALLARRGLAELVERARSGTAEVRTRRRRRSA